MKISQEQKRENRKAIIRAAVAVMTQKGYKSATMREIASEAGVGDATIYNYFPTKDAILFGYYQEHMHQCIEALKTVEGFHNFSLQEQLHTLFETSLEHFLADREFVSETFRLVLLRGSRDWARVKPIRAAFLAVINEMLAAAAEVGEIPEPVFQELTCQLFMDAYLGVVHYWLTDTTDHFENTSVLIDRGLDLACAMLKAGISNKIFDFTIFIFKNHVLNNLDRFIQPVRSTGQSKRPFMEDMNDS